MNDKEKTEEQGNLQSETMPKPDFPINDPSITDVLANVSFIVINDSDIVIYFGYQLELPPNNPIKPSVRIAMSHASFMRMFPFWQSRADFLKFMYTNHFPALSGIDPKRFPEGLNILIGDAHQGNDNE